MQSIISQELLVLLNVVDKEILLAFCAFLKDTKHGTFSFVKQDGKLIGYDIKIRI